VITDKPIIKVPGCPPIAEVMTAVVTYIATFGRIPELDRQGRPKMFYSQRIHDKCYRRPHFDAGQFVEKWDDERRQGRLLPLQDGLQGADDLQRLLDHALERGHLVPDRLRSRLHRLLPKTASGTRARSTTGFTNITQFGVEAESRQDRPGRRRRHRRRAGGSCGRERDQARVGPQQDPGRSHEQGGD